MCEDEWISRSQSKIFWYISQLPTVSLGLFGNRIRPKNPRESGNPSPNRNSWICRREPPEGSKSRIFRFIYSLLPKLLLPFPARFPTNRAGSFSSSDVSCSLRKPRPARFRLLIAYYSLGFPPYFHESVKGRALNYTSPAILKKVSSAFLFLSPSIRSPLFRVISRFEDVGWALLEPSIAWLDRATPGRVSVFLLRSLIPSQASAPRTSSLNIPLVISFSLNFDPPNAHFLAWTISAFAHSPSPTDSSISSKIHADPSIFSAFPQTVPLFSRIYTRVQLLSTSCCRLFSAESSLFFFIFCSF